MSPASATVFSSKAEKYARFRWDYAPLAVRTIFDIAHLSNESIVADIGAGTGILTKHFVGKVKLIYAIEPNLEMRRLAENQLGQFPSWRTIAGIAESTTLPDHCVDMITVAQAIHWFDPQQTRSLRLQPSTTILCW
jgi:ubiquinone/menaquinone biosynthesis C-methylase UbiE